MRSKNLAVLFVLVLLGLTRQAFSAQGFNSMTDVDWSEIDFQIDGECTCPGNYWDPVGLKYEYWEPFLVIDTSATPYYSAYSGSQQTPTTGSTSLTNGGKNKSSDTVDNGESSFAQAHGFLVDVLTLCSRSDYGEFWSESDSLWQSDTLTAIVEPEASLFANEVSQLACMADGAAANVGFPLDALFWCIGSGGSSYPLTGHVADDNTVQANSTIASRLIFLMNRLFMICDPAMANGCGCSFTPIWVKSHYKMAVRRPGTAKVYPLGKSAMIYGSAVNIPYEGTWGPNDEFMWVVYRKKICCTCCD